MTFGPAYPEDWDDSPIAQYFLRLPDQTIARKMWDALHYVSFCSQKGVNMEIIFKPPRTDCSTYVMWSVEDGLGGKG
jgi:hypothetical protein